MIGKVIRVTDSKSVLKQLVGSYGVVKEYAYGHKWVVEFYATTTTMGGLTHTVSEEDFKVVGELY